MKNSSIKKLIVDILLKVGYHRYMKNPVLYVILNGELKMSPGKAAAQAVHSALMLNGNSKEDFLSDYRRTVIVLEAKNSEQIKNLYTYLDETEVDANYYIDEGENEVDPYSVTALAAFVGDNEELRAMFEGFPLYKGHSEVVRVDHWGYEEDSVTVKLPVYVDSRLSLRDVKRNNK